MRLSKGFITKAITMAALCTTMISVACAAPAGTFDTSEIRVTGTASRSVAPTYATLNLGISSQNTNINAAKSNNDRIMSDLIAKLSDLGIAKKDIYTSNISITPNADYIDGKRTTNGYVVANSVTVKINNLDTVSKAIDAAVNSGANDITGLSFQNDPSQQLTDSLTTEAIRDGQHKAEVIAAALGRTLGPVKTVSINTNQTVPLENSYARSAKVYAAALGTSTPVESGSLVVSQDADIVYFLH